MNQPDKCEIGSGAHGTNRCKVYTDRKLKKLQRIASSDSGTAGLQRKLQRNISTHCNGGKVRFYCAPGGFGIFLLKNSI